ncbi:MAG TPA: NAD(P)/FAD-dependent oxidoreductase [Herpetosiphonaceae bacterium]
MRDVVIVGGGPAAYAAAFFLRSKQRRPLMIYEEQGGKTAWRLNRIAADEAEPTPGHGLLDALFQPAPLADNVRHDQVTRVRRAADCLIVDTVRHGSFESLGVVVATGVRPRPLRVPGSEYLINQSLSYSLHAHAAHLAGQRIAVVGATPRMLRGIAEILPSVAGVALVCAQAELPDTALMDQLRWHPRLEIYPGAEVAAVNGGSAVRSVAILQGERQITVPADRIFVDFGVDPASACVRELGVCDPQGFVVIDEYHMTRVDGLFAAGDVTTSAFGENHLLAAAEGLRAGASAYEYVLAQEVFGPKEPRDVARGDQSR